MTIRSMKTSLVFLLGGAILGLAGLAWTTAPRTPTRGTEEWAEASGRLQVKGSSVDIDYSLMLTGTLQPTGQAGQTLRFLSGTLSVKVDEVELALRHELKGVDATGSRPVQILVDPVNLSLVEVFASAALGIEMVPDPEEFSPAVLISIAPTDQLTWADISSDDQIQVSAELAQ
jgi:hypothetical protein